MAITRINSNISALTAQRNITEVGANLQKSIERLSSGLRINRAADDAAGLSVANRLRTQVEGLNQAVANAQDGINVINVAEGALEETTNRLNRIRQLAVQASNTGTNDFKARAALQDEVFQSIDEITRIANTTQFGENFLLNGDFSISSELKAGQDAVGVNIDASPVASTLNNGTSFLNVKLVEDGFSQIVAGEGREEQQVTNTGIANNTDIAVTLARFGDEAAAGVSRFNGAPASGTSTVASLNLNGVSLNSSSIISFTGVLSDGVTQFTGSISVGLAGGTIGTQSSASSGSTELIGAINFAIDEAEKALFGVNNANSVPSSFRTTVTLSSITGDSRGRLELVSDGNFVNQSSINFNVVRSGNIITTANGVTRSGEIGTDSILSGSGKVGNSVTAITGSTFQTGQFEIAISDVQSAQQRKVESNIAFRDSNGAILSRTTSILNTSGNNSLVLNGNFVNGVFTGGTSLQDGDTITLTGTNSDGTTFQGTFTLEASGGSTSVAADSNLDDFQFNSISGLIAELNFRSRDFTVNTLDGTQTRFEDAIFTLTPNGTFQLIDDTGKSDSQTNFTFTFNDGNTNTNNFTIQDDAELIQEGFAEQATFSINGGETVRAEAGEVITLFGPENTEEGVAQQQVTLRVGSGLTAGSDILETKAKQFSGSLNGGESVAFSAGQQDVTFLTPSSNQETAKFLTVDFDAIIDVTSSGTGTDTGTTVLISTVNKGLNFQIGAFDEQNVQFSIGDLKADNLGFGRGSGRTVSDINVSGLEGANEAIRIIDEALDQVNRTRSILGAATNRLESTISNLSVAAENLTASESRIRDADIAGETSSFTKNQILLQAGTSVLAQANFQGQGFLSLLG